MCVYTCLANTLLFLLCVCHRGCVTLLPTLQFFIDIGLHWNCWCFWWWVEVNYIILIRLDWSQTLFTFMQVGVGGEDMKLTGQRKATFINSGAYLPHSFVCIHSPLVMSLFLVKDVSNLKPGTLGLRWEHTLDGMPVLLRHSYSVTGQGHSGINYKFVIFGEIEPTGFFGQVQTKNNNGQAC